jgi:hypothetical protein
MRVKWTSRRPAKCATKRTLLGFGSGGVEWLWWAELISPVLTTDERDVQDIDVAGKCCARNPEIRPNQEVAL